MSKKINPYYSTEYGDVYKGDSREVLTSIGIKGKVDLIMTSPPYALRRKKDYGNVDADKYVEWFLDFADPFYDILAPHGSLVINIGGSWNEGIPTRSLYHYKLLLELCNPERDKHFHLAQDMFWYNPSKLPAPAEWVTVRRIRVKDAVESVWWLSKSPYPQANNRKVLTEYSESMKELHRNGYKAKLRPSGHDISDKFSRVNTGAIPPNLLQIANTESNSLYLRMCRDNDIKPNPARYPEGLAEFFIQMLTEEGDLVVDPFAGSNVTGAVAEKLGRRWIGVELIEEYIKGSKYRFKNVREGKSITEYDSKIIANERYLFCWDEIPGKDSDILKGFLAQNFGIDWVKTAIIEKIDGGMTIEVCFEKKYLSLRLNHEKTKINLEIDKCKSYQFIAEKEYSKLNIYEERYTGETRRPGGAPKAKEICV